MSSRGGFLEGLIVGAILGGLSIIVAAPSSKDEIQRKIKRFKDDNDDVIESTKEKTEDLIEKTKASIEDGFEKLGKILNENKSVQADDVFSSTDKK